MNREDIIMNAVFFGIVILSFVYGFHLADKGIEIDTTPLYWPETFEPYPEPPEDWDYPMHLDTSELETSNSYQGEYHGKEGESEYGEYDGN